jgi:hypothetical protein
MAGDKQESLSCSMEIFEEDSKTYVFFYNDKGEFVKKIHIKKTIAQWFEETKSKIING